MLSKINITIVNAANRQFEQVSIFVQTMKSSTRTKWSNCLSNACASVYEWTPNTWNDSVLTYDFTLLVHQHSQILEDLIHVHDVGLRRKQKEIEFSNTIMTTAFFCSESSKRSSMKFSNHTVGRGYNFQTSSVRKQFFHCHVPKGSSENKIRPFWQTGTSVLCRQNLMWVPPTGAKLVPFPSTIPCRHLAPSEVSVVWDWRKTNKQTTEPMLLLFSPHWLG